MSRLATAAAGTGNFEPSILARTFVEQFVSLVLLIPPLGKGGRGDFLMRITPNPPLSPFFKGGYCENLLNIFPGAGH